MARGLREGRRTFANTLKYVFMATSANFGNMFSMAGASLFLPFLPLMPKQVLLTNLLTDLPEMAIASDNVDDDATALPQRWDVRLVRRFMFIFGLLSSVFDYLTFGALLVVGGAHPATFRTGWFIESVISAASRRPGRAQPAPARQEPARTRPRSGDGVVHRRDRAAAVLAARRAARPGGASPDRPVPRRRDRRPLRRGGRRA